MELWDAYHRDGSLAGSVLVRGEAIPEGLYHVVCEILVRHRDGDYLLTRRDHDKKDWPGYEEASAGGSALSGETALDAAGRELKEETGLWGELRLLDIHVIEPSTIKYGYLCETDCDKDSVSLQRGETIAYRWIKREELIRFLDSEQCMPPQAERIKSYFMRALI